jgi:hypothetical protein
MRIVHVSAAVQHIQDLCRLRDGAEQRVIASLPLLWVLYPTAVPSANLPVEITDPSKSIVTRASCSVSSRAVTSSRDNCRTFSALPRSTRDSVRLIVDMCGSLFSPRVLNTTGSSR